MQGGRDTTILWRKCRWIVAVLATTTAEFTFLALIHQDPLYQPNSGVRQLFLTKDLWYFTGIVYITGGKRAIYNCTCLQSCSSSSGIEGEWNIEEGTVYMNFSALEFRDVINVHEEILSIILVVSSPSLRPIQQDPPQSIEFFAFSCSILPSQRVPPARTTCLVIQFPSNWMPFSSLRPIQDQTG